MINSSRLQLTIAIDKVDYEAIKEVARITGDSAAKIVRRMIRAELDTEIRDYSWPHTERGQATGQTLRQITKGVI